MYQDARKIHLIEELLKIDNEDTLTQLETVLKKTKKEKKADKKKTIYDFLGVMTREDGDAMLKAIEESCETIDADEWK